MRFLLDTNIRSEPRRQFPNPDLFAKLQEHRDESAIAATWELILVSNNVRYLKYFDGLAIENWFESSS